MKLPICTYKEECQGPIGALVINGLSLPRPGKFDPLAKIWSSCRKRIKELYSLDVTGLFLYDDELEVISCSFYLSFTLSKFKDEDPKLYTQRFEDTFQLQMLMFQESIEAFILEEEGYEAYLRAVKNGRGIEVYERIFNRFLRKMNLKIPKDDREKHRSPKK